MNKARKCHCVSKIYRGEPFKHYDEKKYCLESEYDDFGYHEYFDEKGNVVGKTYFHNHLGVKDNYIHGFGFDVKPEKFHKFRTIIDNSVISLIKKKLEEIID